METSRTRRRDAGRDGSASRRPPSLQRRLNTIQGPIVCSSPVQTKVLVLWCWVKVVGFVPALLLLDLFVPSEPSECLCDSWIQLIERHAPV